MANVEKSRYSIISGVFDTQLDEVGMNQIIEELRATYNTEKTYSYSWRIEQLKSLRQLCTDEEATLAQAIYKDFRKSHFESFLTEIGLVKSECENAIANLKSWMKPEKKHSSILGFPSKNSVQHEPLGVALVISAWNYPVYLALNPLVGAIAGGNCCVIKAANYAENTSHALVELVAKYMDQEAIRCVEGNRDLTTILLQQKFDKIFFTGSTFVGKIVARAAAEHLTPVTLELGGKSPCIFDKSSKKYMKSCCKRLIWGAFANGAQTCVRPDFVLVHAEVKELFLETAAETMREFYGDNPSDSYWFARCINRNAFKRLNGLLEANKDNVVVGGEVKVDEKFISPTILCFDTDLEAFNEEIIMKDEVFGPILPVASYTNTEEVIQFIRDLKTGKPLSMYAFGTNKKFIQTIKKRTTSGSLCINDALIQLTNHELPFGGVGTSGIGNYHGRYSFECFSHKRAVMEKSPVSDNFPILRTFVNSRFPPYTEKKQKRIRLLSKRSAGSAFHFITQTVPWFFKELLKLTIIPIIFAIVLLAGDYNIEKR